MRPLVLAFIGCIACVSALGQTAGDYRSAATGNWSVAASWETFDGVDWVPASFQPFANSGNIAIRAGHTITVIVNINSIDDIVIDGTMIVNSGVSVTFNNVNADAITVSNNATLDVSGSIVFNTNAKLRVNGTVIGEPGSAFSGATVTNCIFQAGSTYNHLYTGTPGTIPLAQWNATSTLLVGNGPGGMSSGTAPVNLNQNFGNVTYDVRSGVANLALAGNFTNIQGSFNVLSTNTRSITFASTAGYSLTVNGDFNLAGAGAINFNTATSGTSTLTIVGSFSHTQNTFTLCGSTGTATTNVSVAKNFARTNTTGSITRGSASATATITFNGTSQTYSNTASIAFSGVNFFVQSGSTVDFGSSPLNGNGTFTLNSGGTVIVGSTDSGGAISASGNIRVSGTQTYSSGSTIIYHNNTNTGQFLGSLHPTTAGVTTIIDNTGGVILQPASYTLNGNLVLTNGNFNIAGRSMTFGGLFTANSNFLNGDAATTLTISDGGTTSPFTALRVSGTSVIGTFNIAGTTGRTVTLGANLAVSTDVNLNKGDLQLNGFTLDIGGSVTQTSGLLTAGATSGLTISDTGIGTLPPNLIISGGTLGTMTMNRVASEFITSSNLNITTLNLVAGTFTHTGTVTMTAAGKINVAGGILTHPVAAISVYDVEYNGTNETNTGIELPTTGTILRHLIVSNPAKVNLKAPGTVVNGNLILTAGTFFADVTDITLRGNFQSDATSDLTAGTAFFDGTTTITGSTTPQFGNVTINSTRSLTMSPAAKINVAGNFADNGSFNSNQGTVSLNGIWTDQLLTGASTTNFYGLEINKPADTLNVQHTVTIQHTVQVHDVIRVLTATQVAAGTNQLTLISTASRTARVNPLIVGAAINGSVIVQRYLPNGNNTKQYRYLAAPVTNTFVSDWQQEIPVTGTFSDPSSGGGLISTEISMYYYDETFGGPGLNSRYRNYPASGSAAAAPLVNGRGYSVYTYAQGTTQLDSRGTLGQQQVVVNVTAQSAGGNDGWNLIGNPYPSPVLWDKITRSPSLGSAVYVADNTNLNGTIPRFLTYSGGVGVPSSYHGTIDMGQGFWVHATSAGTVTFDEIDKISSTDSVIQIFRQAAPSDVLRIVMTGAGATDELAIRYLDEAKDSFDKEHDALKLMGGALNLSSLSTDGREMTINAMSSMGCFKQVPLSITGAKAGDYTINASGFESFGSDVDIRLVDKKTSASVDLRKTSNYSFSVTTQDLSTLNTRFVVETGKTRLLTDLPVSGLSICFSDFTANVAVLNSQPEIDYQVFYGQTAASDVIRGNEGTLNLPIATKSLPVGNTDFTIVAKNSCVTNTLINIATVTKTDLTPAPQVTDALACSTDKAMLTATGAGASQSYNWYSSAGATSPLAVTSTGNYEVSNVSANTTYFVSVSNALGCQSERKEIDVKVVNFQPVEIAQNGTVLTSSYFSGNQWYFNGSIIAGQNGPSVDAPENGTYSVKVNVEGCVTEASIVQEVTGLEDATVAIGIYPNPIGSTMNVEFPSGVKGISDVSIVSTSGKIVYSGSFSTPGIITIDTSDIAAGIYIVRFEIDGQIVSKRIVKI